MRRFAKKATRGNRRFTGAPGFSSTKTKMGVTFEATEGPQAWFKNRPTFPKAKASMTKDSMLDKVDKLPTRSWPARLKHSAGLVKLKRYASRPSGEEHLLSASKSVRISPAYSQTNCPHSKRSSVRTVQPVSLSSQNTSRFTWMPDLTTLSALLSKTASGRASALFNARKWPATVYGKGCSVDLPTRRHSAMSIAALDDGATLVRTYVN
mmetsp:Transcript_7028/g.13031  ORF Transcript_7028/g.13031 Transcript_7028/m.13031 type:complete len:209 (-) Transcript_7028:381-1007(-)